MEQHFRRQQLYDLVWSEPLTLVAPRFGMSDVALAKICKRHGIPLPRRGHWAKLKAGKTSSRSLLPSRALGAEETISIGHSDWNKREEEDRALMMADIPPSPDFTEPLVDLVIRIAKLVGHVPPSRNLKSPHRAIAKLLADDAERLEKWRQSPYSYLSDQPFYAAPYEQRRLKLVDAIFKAAAHAGMAPSVPRHRNPGEFTVRVCDSRVQFTLGKPDEERVSWRVTSDIRRPASEPMQLKIDWWSEKPEGLILEWTDKPDTPLETQLSQIVVHLIAAAEMQIRICEHQWYERLKQRKAELIEEERQRQKEAVRKERERQRRLERGRIEKLLHEAMSLRLAEDIRRYVAAVNARNAESPTPIPEPQMADWSRWALEQAERIDPVLALSFLQPAPEEKNDESASALSGHNPAPRPEPVASSPAWHPNRWYTRLHR